MIQDDDGVGWVQTVQYAAWCYLDNFSSSVCHGQRTRVETRGGREDVQLAHLVDATATHTHTISHLEQLIQLEIAVLNWNMSLIEKPWSTSTPRTSSHSQWPPVLPVLTDLSCASRPVRSQCGPLYGPRGQSAPTEERSPHTLCPTRPPRWPRALQTHAGLRKLPGNNHRHINSIYTYIHLRQHRSCPAVCSSLDM